MSSEKEHWLSLLSHESYGQEEVEEAQAGLPATINNQNFFGWIQNDGSAYYGDSHLLSSGHVSDAYQVPDNIDPWKATNVKTDEIIHESPLLSVTSPMIDDNPFYEYSLLFSSFEEEKQHGWCVFYAILINAYDFAIFRQLERFNWLLIRSQERLFDVRIPVQSKRLVSTKSLVTAVIFVNLKNLWGWKVVTFQLPGVIGFLQ
jgi:hypothetical protein